VGRCLDRIASHFTNRLDAKGRVSIPAPFRAVLAKDGFEGLYVYPSLDAEALDCGGHALRREIESLLESQPAFSEERHLFSTALNGASEILKVDPEGRVMLTERLKAFAGVSTEVTFVGQGHSFQIWEPNRFRAYLDEARHRVRDLRRQLGAMASGGHTRTPLPGARE
jgi:MraZ protein